MASPPVRALEPAPDVAARQALRPGMDGIVFTLCVALVVFVVAYSNGGYGLTSRTVLGVGSWLLVMIVVGIGGVPSGRLSRSAAVMLGLFGLFSLWTLASTRWASDPEAAFTEFNRVSLYCAILVLSVLTVTGRRAGRLADGLCLGIAAIAFVALASRLFPHLFGVRRVVVAVPGAEARLSFPIGYWNGLGIFVSLGFPLFLRCASDARGAVVRTAAVAVLPLASAVIYLTSSRGAIITAVAAIIVFLSLAGTGSERRVVAAVVAGGLGSTLAVIVLARRGTLVDGPLSSELAERQGRTAAALLLGCALLASVVFVALERLPHGCFARGVPLARVAGVALLVVLVIGVVVSHPVARFDAFKQIPAATTSSSQHLRSDSGSGRWQFWTAAVDEFRAEPLHGGGAGSYESWWAQHATFQYFLKNAHSLYLEVLGELGAVGLLLLGGALAAGLVGGIRRTRSERREQRVAHAALTALFAAFLVGAAIDWIWQLAAVTAVALAAIGTVLSLEPRPRPAPLRRRGRIGIGTAVVVLVAAWALSGAAGVPWLTAGRIADSQSAVRRGDLDGALNAALDAKSLEPWASSPYVQLALVAERRGELADARRWIDSATRRDSQDWRVWYLAARIQRESGDAAAATRSLATARRLNPRSPLFSAT